MPLTSWLNVFLYEIFLTVSVSNEILNFHFHCKCCTFESLIKRMIRLQLKRNGKRSSELKRRRRFFSLLQTSLLELPQAKWRTQRQNVHRTFILKLLVFGPAWNDIIQQRYRRYLLSCSLPIVNSFFWPRHFRCNFVFHFPPRLHLLTVISLEETSIVVASLCWHVSKRCSMETATMHIRSSAKAHYHEPIQPSECCKL